MVGTDYKPPPGKFQAHYSKTPIYRAPIYRKPRFTAANFIPQIGLNMHIVNKQNPNLPWMFPFPKTLIGHWSKFQSKGEISVKGTAESSSSKILQNLFLYSIDFPFIKAFFHLWE